MNYDKNKDYPINIKIPKELSEELKAIANKNLLSLASIVRLALVEYIKSHKGE